MLLTLEHKKLSYARLQPTPPRLWERLGEAGVCVGSLTTGSDTQLGAHFPNGSVTSWYQIGNCEGKYYFFKTEG